MIGGKRRRRPQYSTLKAKFLRRCAEQRDAQVLTSAELEERMVRAILTRVPQAGQITVADFLQFDVPRKDITPDRVKRCIDKAREIDPAIATAQAFA